MTTMISLSHTEKQNKLPERINKHMGNKKYQGIDSNKRVAWLRMKAQAKYRNELFTLSWEDFKTLWTDDNWIRRGVGSEDLALTRKDDTQAWTISNVKIVERKQHLAYHARKNRTGYRKLKEIQND